MTASFCAKARDALCESEALARQEALSGISYELRFDLDATRATFRGEAIIRFRSRMPAEDSFLDFHGRHLFSFELNGRVVEQSDRTVHRLALPRGDLAASNEIRIAWENDYDRTGVGFHRFQDPEDGEIYLYTDFEPFSAHRLFPCFDQPDLKATYEVTVTAPERWLVVANGRELSRTRAADGRIERKFEKLPPFSTYLVAIVAGPYAEVRDEHGTPSLGVYCRQSLRAHLDPAEIFEITRQGFAFYESLFGQPYAFGKYDQIFVPEFNSGAMENVGCVTFNESQVFRDPPTETLRLHRAEVILHELAHMWFGNLVTMRWWDGLWLNESFATYISFLALSRATRFRACWQDFLGSIKTWAYREDQKPTTHPIQGRVEDTEQTFLNFDGITYGKGASVLKQLRAVIGDGAFGRGLTIYFAKHAFGTTTLADFLAALSEAAGRDLLPWAAEWLETSGVNTIVPERTEDGVAIVQLPGNGDQVLRRHVLEVVRIRPGKAPDPATAALRVLVSGARTPAAIGPPGLGEVVWCNHGDHAYAKVFLDPASLETAKERLADIGDPLTRLGILGTLWEMTRDGVLGPASYLALVAKHLGREPETEICESVLRNASTALLRYVDPGAQAVEGSLLVDAGLAAIASHPAGSDLQMTWGRALPTLVASKSDAERLGTWLERPPPGAPASFVDQGMRWRILTRLAAFDVGDATGRIEAEERRDPSDRGRKSSFAARAALPDPVSKARLFQLFSKPGNESADLLKNGMAAFWWPHQRDGLLALALAYSRILPGVAAEADLEYVARGFVRMLFPHAVATPEVLAAAETTLSESTTPLLRRFLLEETDEMRRTLRLRSLGPAEHGTP